MRTILLFLCVILTNNCDQGSNNYSPKPSNNYSITITDTLSVGGIQESVWILSKKDDYFFGLNKQKNALYIIGLDGKIKSIIRREGDGPEEYNQIAKAGMIDSNIVFIVSQSSVKSYDSNGNFLNSCSGIYELFYITNYPHAFSSNDLAIFSSYHPSSPAKDLQYFSDTTNFLYTAFNPLNCNTFNFGSYEVGSIYRDQYFPNMRTGIFDVGRMTNRLFSVLPFEKQITIYDLNKNGKLTNTIKLYPDHFPQAKGVNPGEDGMLAQIHLIQRNARHTRLRVSSDEKYILLRYKTKRPDDKIEDSLIAYNNSEYDPPYYFSIYDGSGNKLSIDFEDQTDATLFYFENLDEVWFFQNSIKQKNNMNKEGLYILKGKIFNN